MSTPSNGSEPSMEEILASIRALVSQDPAQQAPPPATPTMPHLAQQPPTSEPSIARPIQPDRPQPSLSPSAGPALSRPAAPAPQDAPQGSRSAPARSDEDDLADLLDDPLPADDPRPADVAGPGFLRAGWNAGAAPGVAGADAAGDGPAANAPSSVAAATGFDFGSMIPSRDPAPRATGAEGTPMPALSRFPSLDFKLESATKAPSPAAAPASEPKPAAIDPERLAHPVAGKPAANTPLADGAAALQGPGRYFPAPLTGYSGAIDSKETPTLAPDEKKSATAELVRANEPAEEAAVLARREDALSSPVPTGGSGTSTQVPAAETEPAAKYPGIEPFFKGFGIDTKAPDLRSAGQAANGPSANETKAEPVANLANSTPAVTALEPTTETAEAPALRPRDGSRTLEETVMELLRPILREWVDENLPRIVEEAVRQEVAGAIKNKVEPAFKG